MQLRTRITGVVNRGGCDGGGMWHGWKEKGMYGGFWLGNLQAMDRLEEVAVVEGNVALDVKNVKVS